MRVTSRRESVREQARYGCGVLVLSPGVLSSSSRMAEASITIACARARRARPSPDKSRGDRRGLKNLFRFPRLSSTSPLGILNQGAIEIFAHAGIPSSQNGESGAASSESLWLSVTRSLWLGKIRATSGERRLKKKGFGVQVSGLTPETRLCPRHPTLGAV
jgi:hypothetical protein